jgi:transposase
MTQIRHNGPAEAYYRKRHDAGESHAGALRCIERRIARSVFGHLRTDQINRSATSDKTHVFPDPARAQTA